jgi:osmotically-inducible protein OsmY
MTDNGLQKAVLDELQWQPSINAAHIGVTAKDGVVTLSGDVSSYVEKWTAEQAARRVYGVKGLADEIKVRSPFEVDDTDVAQNALQALSSDIEVPANKVMVKVEGGWVTLNGSVDWYFQRNAAEADVRKLKGVLGVTNNIVIKQPSVQATDVRAKLKAAFERQADIDESNITVAVDGGKVTLSGRVDTWGQDSLAVDTAWSAPGVTQVDDQLSVG